MSPDTGGRGGRVPPVRNMKGDVPTEIAIFKIFKKGNNKKIDFFKIFKIK